MRTTRACQLALSGAFLCMIAAPLVDQALRSDDARGPAPEQRRAAPSPAVPADLAAALAYPQAFESRHMDVFGLRDKLLRLRGIVYWFGLRRSPSPLVERGAQDWTFTTIDESREAWRGTLPMDAEELAQWTDALRERRDWVARQGADYAYAVAPNKESIYPEHLPPSWARIAPDVPTRLDQLALALAPDRGLLLDLRPALAAAKALDQPGDETYTRLGTHWNGNGTLAAAQAVIERLRASAPWLRPLRRQDWRRYQSPGNGDSWGSRLYIDDLLEQHEWVPASDMPPACDRNLLSLLPHRVLATEALVPEGRTRLLVFHDSFGPYLEPLLAKHADVCCFVQSSGFDPDLVRAFKPDFVLDLHVERALQRAPRLDRMHADMPAVRVAESEPWRIAWAGDSDASRGDKAQWRLPQMRLDPALSWEIHVEGDAGEQATLEVYPQGHGAQPSRRGKSGFPARGVFRCATRLDPLEGDVRPLVRLMARGDARIDYIEIRRR